MAGNNFCEVRSAPDVRAISRKQRTGISQIQGKASNLPDCGGQCRHTCRCVVDAGMLITSIAVPHSAERITEVA